MTTKKIFKGFVSNEFENPTLTPINDSDVNYLELNAIYNDVGGVILNSTNSELLEDMVIVDFKGFTDGSSTKSLSINAKDGLPNSVYLNFYQNGIASDGICNREYIEVILLDEEIDYTDEELSTILYAQSVLVKKGLKSEASKIGAPIPPKKP